MRNDDDFEAEIKSGITPDVAFIRKNDEIVNQYKKKGQGSGAIFLLFLLAAVSFYFLHNLVLTVILGIIAFISGIVLIGNIRMRSQLGKADLLKEIYEEGLLVPGMIVKTNPVTVMAIANITAHNGCPEQNACYVLEVKHLPGAAGTLYEKIPCSCMFRYEEGDYHAAFQPHPLNWGTKHWDEIRSAVWRLDQEQEENYADEWEVIKEIAAKFPNLEPDQMLLMDEHYVPLGIKHYMEDEYDLFLSEQIYQKYPKKQQFASHIIDFIPAAELYNDMIDLAVKHEVYEYISTHCKDEDLSPLTNPGYFTYVSDPELFERALKRRGITLANEEYPLIAGNMLITNKGCWDKEVFLPWPSVTIAAKLFLEKEIETNVNGKCIAQFKCSTACYENKERFKKEDMPFIRKLEYERINHFLEDLKELCMKKEYGKRF